MSARDGQHNLASRRWRLKLGTAHLNGWMRQITAVAPLCWQPGSGPHGHGQKCLISKDGHSELAGKEDSAMCGVEEVLMPNPSELSEP